MGTKLTPAERAAKREQYANDAYRNATERNSLYNYDAIFTGFSDKGIDEVMIIPRENVFTYNAWRKLNRQVKRGEKGVKILTYIAGTKTDDAGELIGYKIAKTVSVFHISQTELIVSAE